MALTKVSTPKTKPAPREKSVVSSVKGKTSTKGGKLPTSAVKKPKAGAKKTKAPTHTKPGIAPSVATGTFMDTTGFCVKCKTKETPFKGEIWESPTGRRMAKGPHKACGTMICRILAKA